uniref:Rho GTPase-activating protein 40 n=1 Tax=Anthurium amnicola TaxID=1678845 RepID=A0A1D1XII3_9ARAE
MGLDMEEPAWAGYSVSWPQDHLDRSCYRGSSCTQKWCPSHSGRDQKKNSELESKARCLRLQSNRPVQSLNSTPFHPENQVAHSIANFVESLDFNPHWDPRETPSCITCFNH